MLPGLSSSFLVVNRSSTIPPVDRFTDTSLTVFVAAISAAYLLTVSRRPSPTSVTVTKSSYVNATIVPSKLITYISTVSLRAGAPENKYKQFLLDVPIILTAGCATTFK